VARLAPIVAGLLGLMVVGLIDAIAEVRNLSRRLQFTVEFQRRWGTYFGALQRGQPAEADYIWLAQHQTGMTAELGPADRIDYRPPFAGSMIPNYPALTNTLAAARGGRGAHQDMVAFVDHLLISCGGVLQDGLETVIRRMKNPVYLVGRGLRFVLSLPLLLLSWSGLLPAASVKGARDSWIFRLVQFLVAVVVALAAVMTVVIGWSAFVAQVRVWFPWIP